MAASAPASTAATAAPAPDEGLGDIAGDLAGDFAPAALRSSEAFSCSRILSLSSIFSLSFAASDAASSAWDLTCCTCSWSLVTICLFFSAMFFIFVICAPSAAPPLT